MSNSLSQGADIIRNYCKNLPTTPGVYRMLDEKGEVLYVGKARALKKRVINYTHINKLPVRLQRMVSLTTSMEFIHTKTEVEALLLESNLIKKFRPPYNVVFRDDKTYPYIHVDTAHPYPKAVKFRGKKQKNGKYFGPFANAGAVNRTLTILQKAFRIRNCSDHNFSNRSRPCLQYHIERCTAPCVDYVSKDEYAGQINDMISFLSGESNKIKEKIYKDMQAASETLEFEHAAKLRNRLYALNSVTASQDINIDVIGDADVVGLHEEGGKISIQIFFFRGGQNYGNRSLIETSKDDTPRAQIMTNFLAQFYENKPLPPTIFVSDIPDELELLIQAFSEQAGRKVEIIHPQRGDKKRLIDFVIDNARQALIRHISETASQKKLLEGVAELFDLDRPPERIEVYDNSHLAGTGMIGAMIVAGPEGFRKTAYRKFNMQKAGASDDYAMMREMLSRRFSRSLKDDEGPGSPNWPDLLLIDGGKGQLSAVREVLEDLGISEDVTLVAIAKGPDRNAGREEFFMTDRPSFQLPHNDPVLHYLQRLRDESHRFVIGAQRSKRTAAIPKSPLDEIDGIGPRKKKALLAYFGSSKEVSSASIQDLMKVEGISEKIAEKIYSHFHH
jgi:excinuclease ABC subunit C